MLVGIRMLAQRTFTHRRFWCSILIFFYRTGIGPETFAFISPDGNFTGGDPITPDELAFFEQHGFYITGSDYIQRPEGEFRPF